MDQDGKLEGAGIRVLKPKGIKKWGAIILYIICFFPSAWLLTVPKLAPGGLFGFILSVWGCLYYYIKMVLSDPELRLSSEVFSYTTFGREKRYRWIDIGGPFDVYGGGKQSFPFIGFRLIGALNTRPRNPRSGNSYSNKLPGNFGLDSSLLVNLLNQYWRNATGSQKPNLSDEAVFPGASDLSSSKIEKQNFVIMFIWLAVSAVALLLFVFLHGPINPSNGGKRQYYCTHAGANIVPTPTECLNLQSQ